MAPILNIARSAIQIKSGLQRQNCIETLKPPSLRDHTQLYDHGIPKHMPTMLMPDAQVPSLEINTTDGDKWTLANQSPDNFTMIVFYRGLHCPVCKSYLQKLHALSNDYKNAGFAIVAVSMNTESLAKQTVDDWQLHGLTIGHSLSEADARAWGLYISTAIKDGEADMFNEPGLFWVRSDGRLYLADVSNMPWSRPDLAFLQSKIPFAVEKKYPARGNHSS